MPDPPQPTAPEALADLVAAYRDSLPEPLDGMWDALTAAAQHWALGVDGAPAGFACIDHQDQLLRFHVVPRFARQAPALFADLLRQRQVAAAIVSTAEPGFLPLCLDHQTRVRVHSYLFRDLDEPPAPTQSTDDDDAWSVVEEGQRDEVEAFQRAALDADLGEWLTGYVAQLVARRELFARRRDGTIVGTGEARASTQPPFADLGVIVGRRHRGRGLATAILRRLKRHCAEQGWQPICSTTADNAAARRAIEKAGFVSRHRLLEVTLRPAAAG